MTGSANPNLFVEVPAYLAGLEQLAVRDPQAHLSTVPSVASFLFSRVETVVDQRLVQLGTSEADELRGQAAIAPAQLAYQLFRERFSGPQWDALVARALDATTAAGPPPP